METLKALPLRSSAIAWAQLVTPAAILSTFEIAAVSVATIFAGQYYLIAVAVLVVPLFNFILVAVDNLSFLFMPTRMNAKAPGDFRSMAQIYVSMLLKMLLLAIALGFGGGLGGLVSWLSGSWIVGGVVAWLCLLGEAVLLVPCIAWAFDRFDVTLAKASA